MSVNERIIAAATTVVDVCVPGAYVPEEGAETQIYCTFNVTQTPAAFGDDEPEAMLDLCQLHLWAPRGVNTVNLRKELRHAVARAGFTHPSVADASDLDGQHYVLEFEDAEEV